MSEQGGPEAWQKLWSMWVPSTTDASGATGPGAVGAKDASSPFPTMAGAFPSGFPGMAPGTFPQGFSGAIPGFPSNVAGFPGMPGTFPGVAGVSGNPFSAFGPWGQMAALAAMTPGMSGIAGTSGQATGGASDPMSAASAVFNAPFAGLSPSLSMMSEMIAPLTQVDELDKRIADLRAVEHWLKLNLQMLQSTTQALEVQRATLATLRAFGAATAAASDAATQSMRDGAAGASPDPSVEAAGEAMAAGLAAVPALDPQRWWAMLNDQFQQMAAAAASVAPPTDAGETSRPAVSKEDVQGKNAAAPIAGAGAGSRATAAPPRQTDGGQSVPAPVSAAKQPVKPVAKRAPPRPATTSKGANGSAVTRSASQNAGGRPPHRKSPSSV
ncbi:PhaM family polyhydroxyalkanoate granule multifunctional regulatory protein [Robbsia andropogonis]|uniref:PhaM family polyhydroxyalkanoate granule multifunctional regulatory protein n=1 Tax=Robbsia andropogonis TaxID=28092 RepID=UPI00209FA7FE|nr:PhaM family polyhydroxyalkanoate granule multifunctional regulatory protein [Robbsia andropogonis]MCP1120651.1 hypothetical protein [Robbsia andropogonis]MCP1130386.1 hypothetical protein [Robbsia andropogonis]